FGGKAGRGRKVDIPARPFLMLTPQDEEDILQDVQDYWQSILK
ncbi:phage virion morphogenesis protein, partial [Glaesserella parasuis]|nr:phage virion morphogenesis protein [Glaesserella parasuis]MCT8793259.1 phage virion morphogenesis protein [Glaesserella parasuis]